MACENEKKCGNCRHWERDGAEPIVGTCPHQEGMSAEWAVGCQFHERKDGSSKAKRTMV